MNKKEKRVARNEYYMALAITAAKRSSCERANVGSIIVKDGIVITTGYNGAAKSEPDCLDSGCIMEKGRCVRTIHAEENAIINCAKVGVSTKDTEIYVTHRPCDLCSRKIINAGIKKVYFLNDYKPNNRNIKLSDYVLVEKITL